MSSPSSHAERPSGRHRVWRSIAASLAFGLLVGPLPAAATEPTGSWSVLPIDPAGELALQTPTALALSPQGDVYVADEGTQQIQAYSPDGAPLAAWSIPQPSGPTSGVRGVAADGDGNVYVLTDNHVTQLDPDGTVLQTWQPQSRRSIMTGLAGGADGSVFYVGQSFSQSHYEPQMAVASAVQIVPEVEARRASTGSGLTQHEAGRAWLAVDASGNRVLGLTGLMDCPYAGHVESYCAFPRGFAVLTIGPDGKPLREWRTLDGSGPGRLRSLGGVAADSHGLLYVLDPKDNSVQLLAPSGQPLARWSELGADLGPFSQPSSIAVNAQDQVYVSDTGNSRVLVWTPAQPPPAPPLPGHTDASTPLHVNVGDEFALLTGTDFAGNDLHVEAQPTDESIVHGEGWLWSRDSPSTTWTYKAVGAGTTQIHILRYADPGREGREVARQLTFTVTVQ
jgi:DNA-binding beta-propeller fold protein YncE